MKQYYCVWTLKMELEVMLVFVGKMEVMVKTVMVVMVLVDNGDTSVGTEVTATGNRHRS